MTLQKQLSVFVMVLLVLGSGTGAGITLTQQTDESTTVETVGEPIRDDSTNLVQDNVTANVTFRNQTTTGEEVTIASATVPEGGFVVVHTAEILQGNILESIVGVSEYLTAGNHTRVTVPLDESLSASQTLVAVVYQDTNGNQSFDFVETQGSADGPYTVENQIVADDAVVELIEETTTTETPTATVTTETTETTETPTTTTTTETPTTTEEPRTTTPTEPESFGVSQVTFPSVVESGEVVTVSAVVSNPNDRQVTQEVTFRIDGDVVVRESITLEPNAETEVTFSTESADLRPGDHFISVFTPKFGEITVFEVAEESNTTTTTTTY